MTLTDFLRARFDEVEAVARRAGDVRMYRDDLGRGWIEGPHGRIEITDGRRDIPLAEAALLDHLGWNLPGRVLAQVKALRAVVDEHSRCDLHDSPGDECDACQGCGDGSVWPCPTVLHLASIYADHPDFREEWKL